MSSSEIIEDILEHHGTKGMKWGVRRSITGSSAFKSWSKLTNKNVQRHHARVSARAAKKVAKKDRKFEKTASSLDKKIEFNNAVTKPMNDHITRINAKPIYKKAADDGRLMNDLDPVTKKYHKEYNDTALAELNKYARTQSNASNTKHYEVRQNPNDFLGFTVVVVDKKTKKIQHAEEVAFKLKLVKDDKGRIVKFVIEDDSLAQSAIEDILEHHGVKGMHWGVRRASSNGGPQSVTVRDRGKKIKTSGGTGHPAHPDAVRAHTIGRVAKKSGVKALSNDDLQAYTRRLQLEQSLSQLNSKDKSKGAKFATGLASKAGNRAVDEVLNESARRVKRALR